MEAIGVDLINLIQHLYRKKAAQEALSELTLRTHEKFEPTDVQMAPTAKEIAYTRWFAAMKARYKVLREDLLAKNESKEAEETIVGLYPNGCTTEQILEAFTNASDMLTFQVKSAIINDWASQRTAALDAKGTKRLTAKELVKEFVSGPVLTALTPSRWWETQPDLTKRKYTTVCAVGLRTEPPSLVVEYKRITDSKKRQRTIYLHEVLSANGSTTQLARKLAATHGALLGEETFQKHLVKLQKLMREGASLSKQNSVEVAAAKAGDSMGKQVSASNAQPPPPAATKGPNKADLGLLYRDPEAALKDVDLQDADEFTVKEFKAKMTEAFQTKVIKPGDPGYKYDKRQTFVAVKKSEWDEDSDDDF